MPGLKNKRHELFASALAEGKPASQAYTAAGYKPNDGNCIRLKGHERVQARVAELKERREIEKINGRDPNSGRFVTGNGGGGRPKGSRNRLGEAFIQDAFEQWKTSGLTALQTMAENDPSGFVRVIAGILPKEIDATLSVHHNLFAQATSFNQAYELARQVLDADKTKLIELEAQFVPAESANE